MATIALDHAGPAGDLADRRRSAQNRLSYPLTYWNALGLLAGLGIVFCAHLTTSLQEPPLVRVLAAAPIPALACTILFTFSRGAIGATGSSASSPTCCWRGPAGSLTGILAAWSADGVRARERL